MKKRLIFLLMEENPRIIVGRLLRQARRERGWTQARVAREVGIARESVYRIERGRMPSGDVASRLCDVLGLDRSEMNLDRRETDPIYLYPPATFLRDRRRSLGLTLAACAAASGVSVSTLSRFEKGVERSRALARHDKQGGAVGMVNEGLARVLGFDSIDELTTFWQRGYL